jgi:hypothetical protein
LRLRFAAAFVFGRAACRAAFCERSAALRAASARRRRLRCVANIFRIRLNLAFSETIAIDLTPFAVAMQEAQHYENIRSITITH